MFDFMLNDEEKKLRQEAVDFIKKEVPNELLKSMDRDEIEYPYDYVRKLGAANLLGLRFPKEWGGRGLGWSAEVAVLEEFGTLGTSLACLYSLPSIIGDAIALFGTDAQKEKYLKPTLAGKMICAEALTEPRGGSDFFGATTKAEKKGDYYILNGQKRFIVGAKGADYFLVYVRTAFDAPAHESISVFIVERDFGVEVQEVYGLMGSRGSGTGRIIFKDVKVPAENLVGPLNGGGMIFNKMMIPERLTSAAGAVGTGRACVEVAARYSTQRKAFGRAIMKFQAVNFMLADSLAALDAARGLVYAAARKVDSGQDARRLVSEAKKVGTENSWLAINNSMQIMGGIGYTNVYPIERLLRDSRLAMIWTGTNQIMNALIQHEYYKELAKSGPAGRDVEEDAVNSHLTDEKVFE
ncbi:MAG: Acyl-CoA dehydrogenase [bacterium ADurb.Bin236]|nr:MAG: Acyl-CoA dehydrogenase [bacterium ADurb.Bin236]